MSGEGVASGNDEAKRATLVGNERAKLSATFLNNVAVAVLGSGLIAPFFVMVYGLGNLSADQIRFFRARCSRLGYSRSRLTLSGSRRARRASGMTWLELYALLAPLAVLALGGWLAYDANRWRWR